MVIFSPFWVLGSKSRQKRPKISKNRQKLAKINKIRENRHFPEKDHNILVPS